MVVPLVLRWCWHDSAGLTLWGYAVIAQVVVNPTTIRSRWPHKEAGSNLCIEQTYLNHVYIQLLLRTQGSFMMLKLTLKK